MDEIKILRAALTKAVAQLNKLTPLLQTDTNGNGMDCSEHFQALIDAQAALAMTKDTCSN